MQATIGKDLFLDQFQTLAEAYGVTISWTALLSGMHGPNSHRAHLERTHELINERGLNIFPQVTPRPLCMDFDFDAPFPFERQAIFKPTMKTDRERAGGRSMQIPLSARRSRMTCAEINPRLWLAGRPAR